MSPDPSSTRPWRIRAPIGGLVVFAFTALISLSIWKIPTARAWFSFIPDALSWIIFWFAVCVFLSALYYGVITLSRKLRPTLFSYATLRTIAITLIMYFAGAFLLETLGVAPKVDNWSSVTFDVVRFFVLYTAALIFVLYLTQKAVRNAIINYIETIVSKFTLRMFVSLLRAIILFAVPAIILAKLQLIPVNPDITTWFSGAEIFNTLIFLCIYGFVIVVLFSIMNSVFRLVRYLFRPVPPTEPAYELYGQNIAWWIRLSIMFTIIAQFVCFFTAYFGLKLLLSEEGVSSIAVFSIPIPHKIADLLHVGEANIVWTQLQVISLVVAFILSAGISYFAAMTIQNLLDGHPVALPLPILVVILGLISTYCGFTMWNGSAATAEELRQAIQQTKSLVVAFRDVDNNTLGAAATDATAQVSALQRRIEQDERQKLETQFAELSKAVLLQEESYQKLVNAAISFDETATAYDNMAENERSTGETSGSVAGRGAVARELERISRAYKSAAGSIKDTQSKHDTIKSDMNALRTDTYKDIIKREPLETLRDDLRKTQVIASDFFNIDPRPVLQGLQNDLAQPLPPVFSSDSGVQQAQQEALKSVKHSLADEAETLGKLVTATPKLDPPAQREDPSAQDNAQILEGNALVEDLGAFVKVIDEATAARRNDMATIMNDLNTILNTITVDSQQGSLFFDRSRLEANVNKARNDLSGLASVSFDPLYNQLNKLGGAIEKLDTKVDRLNEYIKLIDIKRISALIPKSAAYPKVDEFKLSPLALGVIKYFYVSLPLLIVQIFIDFGYTIGLLIGVSSMHHRRPGASPPPPAHNPSAASA